MFTAWPTAVTASLPSQAANFGENSGQFGHEANDLAVSGVVAVS
jgi:hypothetical protein